MNIQDHGENAAAAAVLNGYPAKPRCTSPPPHSLHDVCLQLKERLHAFLAEEPEAPLLRNVQAQLRMSIEVVEEALGRHPPEQISISYNGGKDCLVLLIVILACLARRFPSPSNANAPNESASPTPFPEKFQAVYIVSPHFFPEADTFVASSGAEYYLEVSRYMLPMKKGLESYLVEHPSIKAIFVGTRRTDPHGEKLGHFNSTDADWPAFIRVHPLIDWHYDLGTPKTADIVVTNHGGLIAEIWAFIRHLAIPYCPLYDQGYTSLGGKYDTHPNPRLKREGGEGFRPAYELMEDDEERLGRDG